MSIDASPARSLERPVTSPSGSLLPGYFPDLRVLVIDDQEYMRELMRAILRALEIRAVRMASDAAHGLEALAEQSVDLIFCDWEMGALSGLDFVRMVRHGQRGVNPYMPIIMVTGHNNVSRVKEARDAGANDFLVKPVSAKSIFSRIRLTMERPRPFIRTNAYLGPDRRRQDLGPPAGIQERRH